MSDVEKCRAALLGLAVGNVMGLASEGKSKREVVDSDLQPPINELKRPADDDVAMTVVLAEHLLRHPRGIHAKTLLQGYVDWMSNNGRGIGGLTLAVLRLARSGHPGAAQLIWLQRGGRRGMVLGNGSMMRCLPLAIRYRGNLEKAIEEARLDTSLTHWDERARWATAAGVLILAHHINESEEAPVDPVEETIATLQKLGPP